MNLVKDSFSTLKPSFIVFCFLSFWQEAGPLHVLVVLCNAFFFSGSFQIFIFVFFGNLTMMYLGIVFLSNYIAWSLLSYGGLSCLFQQLWENFSFNYISVPISLSLFETPIIHMSDIVPKVSEELLIFLQFFFCSSNQIISIG